MRMYHNNKKMLKEHGFFDITMADSYYIIKVRSFIFTGEIELIFTLRSNEVDILLKTYATLTKYGTCVCRPELIDNYKIRISEYAKMLISKKVEPVAFCIGAALIKDGVGEYVKVSVDK